MEKVTSTVKLHQGTPTQPRRMPHLGGEFWNQLGEHCARVFDTEYSTDREQETSVSVVTENEFLIYKEAEEKVSQEEIHKGASLPGRVIIPRRDRWGHPCQ